MGYILILNNEIFADKTLPSREGSRKDLKRLNAIFQIFNFRMNVINNPKVKEIRCAMQQLENEDLDNALCLVVVIMTHGTERNCAYAYDKMYSINKEILQSTVFKKFPRLPKIVITQACKEPNSKARDMTANEPYAPFPINTLRFDSTYEKCTALRIPTEGSPFIQILCDKLENSGLNKTFGILVDEMIDEFKDRINEYVLMSDHQQPTKHINSFSDICFGSRVKQAFNLKESKMNFIP